MNSYQIKIFLLLIFIGSTAFTQDKSGFHYGLKGGLTWAGQTNVGSEEDLNDATYMDHRIGMNGGVFAKFYRIFLTDLSFVQKGSKEYADIRLNYISWGIYICFPYQIYPFWGIHKDYLVSKRLSENFGTVHKTNWSYSVGLGVEDLKFYKKNWLVEVKLDWIDQKPALGGRGGFEESMTKNVSLDLKVGVYLK